MLYADAVCKLKDLLQIYLKPDAAADAAAINKSNWNNLLSFWIRHTKITRQLRMYSSTFGNLKCKMFLSYDSIFIIQDFFNSYEMLMSAEE